MGNRGPCQVGGVEIFGLDFPGVHLVVWYLHGSPQTEVTWALGKTSGFPGVGLVGCELHLSPPPDPAKPVKARLSPTEGADSEPRLWTQQLQSPRKSSEKAAASLVPRRGGLKVEEGL